MHAKARRDGLKALGVAGLLVLALSATGCRTPSHGGRSPDPPAEDPAATQQLQESRLREELLHIPEEALLVQTPTTEDRAIDQVARYNLTIRDGELKDILLAFGRQCPYNFVLDPEIAGSVTVDLRDVSLERALEAILSPHQLKYRIDGDLIWVHPPHTKTELFSLNYVITARSSSRSVSGDTITGAGGGASATGTGAGTTTGLGGTGGGDSVSGSESFDLYQELEEGLSLLLSDRGRLGISRESGLVTVIDLKENLVQIRDYLDKYMESVHRQVMIEAKVLEVDLDAATESGVDWTAVLGDVSIRIGADRTADNVFTGTLSTKDLTTVVRAISRRNQVNIRTSPRVSTLNNQTAMIVLGDEEVFFETTEERDPDTGRIISTRTTPRSVTIGVSLSVVPQISKKGMIMMNAHVRITEKIGEKVAPDGTVVPEVSVRETDNVARVQDGNTMLVAGLISERHIYSRTGMPLLSKIPLIGPSAFTSKSKESKKTEVVIFLTPRVVRK